MSNQTKTKGEWNKDWAKFSLRLHRARCNPCFRNHFLVNKQIVRREIAVTWWMREERSDWTSKRQSSNPSFSSSSSSSTSLHRSSSFSEKPRFFISKGFKNLPPLLYLLFLLLDTSFNGFLTVFDFDFSSLSLSLCLNLLWKAGYFYFVWFFIVRSSESWLGVALNRVC